MYLHFAMEARPYPIDVTVFISPFYAVLMPMEELCYIALPVGEDKGEGGHGKTGVGVVNWVP